MQDYNEILYNSIITPDGTVLVSRHRHDFVSHTDSKNGQLYAVDGGNAYLRRLGPMRGPDAWIENSVSTQDEHSVIREKFEWGKLDHKTGEYNYIKLKDLDTSHIEAILMTQFALRECIRQVFHNELQWRKDNA